MVFNAQHTVLPFYTSTAQQWHNATGAYYKDVEIIFSKNRMLPWQLTRTPNPNAIESIKLICVTNASEVELLDDIPAGQLVYYTANGKDYIQYIATKNLQYNLQCGWFYLKVYDGVSYYYSEIFVVKNFEDTTDAALSYDGLAEIAADNSNAIEY